jgi:predicted alpha/beta superfamily hydrolase
MGKKIALILLILAMAIEAAQITFEINSTPRYYQPMLDTIYLAASFQSWDPSDATLAFSETDGLWRLQLDLNPGTELFYKFTRGDWARVETRADGGPLDNRQMLVGSDTTIRCQVAHWQDMVYGNHTVQGYVYHLDSNFPMNSLERRRRVWVWLPLDYFNSENRYPVFYMHDGQNLFDEIYSFAGEWGVDESMQTLFHQGFPAIIVGIDNGGAQRIAEYTPWRHSQYGGGEGEAYLTFIVDELKPFIDSYFRTLPGREFTGLFGSSLGGYISFYGIMEYPEIFGKAGVFSPSFWFSDSLWTYMESIEKTEDLRIYMLGGENESATMVSNLERMAQALENAGFTQDEFTIVTHHDGIHNEWYWQREFPAAFRWLNRLPTTLAEKVSNESSVGLSLFPNPFNPDTAVRFFLPENQFVRLVVYDISGRRIRTLHTGYCPAGQQQILWDGKNGDGDTVSSGIYLIMLQNAEQTIVRKSIRMR